MPEILFEGVVYQNANEMPADVRERYKKKAPSLPDRDGNGIPDLLEIDSPMSSPLPPPQPRWEPGATPVSSAVMTGGKAPPIEAQRMINLAAKGFRWARWIYFGAFALVLACVALAFLGIISLIKSSGGYQLAMDTASANLTVQQVLGAPIHDGLLPSGSTSEDGASGTANFSIPVSGSRQSGTLEVSAVKEENTWRIQSMVLNVGGQSFQINP